MARSVKQEYIARVKDESNIVLARAIYSCITQKQSYTILLLLSMYIIMTNKITKFDLPQ